MYCFGIYYSINLEYNLKNSKDDAIGFLVIFTGLWEELYIWDMDEKSHFGASGLRTSQKKEL